MKAEKLIIAIKRNEEDGRHDGSMQSGSAPTPRFMEGFLEEVRSQRGLDVWELAPRKRNSDRVEEIVCVKVRLRDI